MEQKTSIEKLESKIQAYFESYSAKRLALATFLVGFVSIGASLIAYFFSLNVFIASGVFLFTGLVFVNVAIILIVPPTRVLNEARSLLIDAVNRPSLIKEVRGKQVRIANQESVARVLKSHEQKAWDSIVMPFFLKATTSREKLMKQSIEADKNQKALEALEAKREAREAEEAEFMKLKAQMEQERVDLQQRSQELMDAENLVISRLNEVEEAETRIAQMRDDLKAGQESVSRSDSPEFIQKKEAELIAKEAEMEALQLRLQEDRQIVEQQKTELNQMKGELLSEMEGSDDLGIGSSDTSDLQKKLDARARELDAAARDLEERSKYIDSVEESLVDRLGQLTEREAFLEQGEINQGIRSD